MKTFKICMFSCVFLFGCSSNRQEGKSTAGNGVQEKIACEEIQRLYEKARLALKRPAKSYLQAVPVKELMKLIPKGE